MDENGGTFRELRCIVTSECDGMGIPVGTLSVVLDLHKPRVEDETPVEDNKDVVEGTQASHDRGC